MKALRQRGGFVIGLVVGLLIGLALALAVALYITKAPIPFVNKVPQRTAEQDTAEAQRNRNWDPNAPLAGKAPLRPAPAASAATPEVAPPASAEPAKSGTERPATSTRDPAAILAGVPTAAKASAPAAAQAFDFYVQAGAFTRGEDAEQQRARLALLGQIAAVSEREQAGRIVYRVRIGPFDAREQADDLQGKLREQSVESQIVRVERR